MRHYILILFILITIQKSFSQDIYGEWLKINAVNINKNYHTNPYNIRVAGYQKIIIEKDKIHLITSPFDESCSLEGKFNLDNKSIVFFDRKYLYLINKDTLFLFDDFVSDDINDQPLKCTYVRSECLFMENINISDLVYEIVSDTLTISNFLKESFYSSWLPQCYYISEKYHFQIPQFTGPGFDFVKFIQKNLYYKFKETDSLEFVFSKVSLLIDAKGKIIEKSIEEGKNDIFNIKLLKVLNSSENEWKEKNSSHYYKLIFPIKFIENGWPSRLNSSNTLEEGNKLTLKNDYMGAIEKYTQAIFENKSNIDAYYNRAILYLKLEQIDKACFDWEIIYKMGRNDSYNLLKQYCWDIQ